MNYESKTFLRYPGGKGRMLEFLIQHLPSSSAINGKYVEPFVGGGSVYFSIQPKKAILSDANQDLIDLYLGIKEDARNVWKNFVRFGRTKTEYFRVRDIYTPRGLPQKAARVLFLNRTCFKGMWRHNSSGNFNVGYGGQDRRWVINQENLLQVKDAIRHVKFLCNDFEEIVDKTKEGDFIFSDPPYRPNEKEQLHSHYVGKKFTFDDHIRLSKALKRATKRKVKWALTISAHPEILALYKGNCIFIIPRGTGRKPGSTVNDSGEVLITNYSKPERGISQ